MALSEYFKKKKKSVDKWAKRRAYINKFISRGQALLRDPGPSEHNLRKVLAKRVRTEEGREAQKARSKRRDRMLQLAKMPGNKGMTELKRLRKQGADKPTWSEARKLEASRKDAGIKGESAADKAERQRKAQLAKMPGGRGKMPTDKQIDKGSAQLEAQRRKAAGQDTGAQQRKAEMAKKQKAKEQQAAAQKKAIEEGRKRQATKAAEAKKAEAKKAGQKKVADQKKAAGDKAQKQAADKRKAQIAAQKKAAEERRKAQLRKMQEALKGKR